MEEDILDSYAIMEIILSSDESKRKELIREHNVRLDSRDLGTVILSLNETHRLELYEKFKDRLSDWDKAYIIMSFKEEKRIELLKENLDELTSHSIVRIINSLQEERRIDIYLFTRLLDTDFERIIEGISDGVLEKTLDTIDYRFSSNEIAIIIKNIRDEEKRILDLEKMKDKIEKTNIKEIVESLNENAKFEIQLAGNVSYNSKAKRVKLPIETFFTEEEKKFFKGLNFSYFNEEININSIGDLRNYSLEEWHDFIKFAKVLGCFSDEKMLDKKGKETQAIVGQKATTTLRDMINSGTLKLEDSQLIFKNLNIDVEANQKFLKFISQTVGRKKFENLEMLLRFEQQYSGLFARVMSNFERAEKYRETLDNTGKPIRVPWEEALEKFYKNEIYIGITEENSDIAEVFAANGLSQATFDQASILREEAKKNNIPEHILGKHIREETILDTIERIKSQTEQEIESGRQIIEELYSKKFTYEWLSKNDPQNSIIGLFVSCCASITSNAYGRYIAGASVLAPDVQNLVVRDSEGNIISKGTVYVNEKEGYAVINDFELNQKYRKHEESAGRYFVDSDNIEEQERQQIFETFKRGLQAFIKEYDLQHSDNPLKQINVGMGYNRLKRQVERFKKATSNLEIPEEYNFWDATAGIQYILYQRESTDKEIDTENDGERGIEL